MAIIWAEGFDHYGNSPNGGRDAMLQGAWAQFSWGNGNPHQIDATQKRTGSYSLRHSYNSVATAGIQARRVIGAAKTVIGCAAGWFFESLPSGNGAHGFEFRNNANQCIALFTIESDGAIGLYIGNSRTLIASSDPVITSSSWQHIEAKLICDNIVGEVEIRVNGLVVLHLTNIDLGSLGATQIVFGIPGTRSGGSLVYYTDDIIVWDDTGSYNNDFVGPCRVTTILPNSDTSEADWALTGSVNGYGCINNVPPDGDTTYLQADDVGDISEFGIQSLPPETSNIAGVYVPILAKLDDAGIGSMKVGFLSGSDLLLGDELTLTTAYTYWNNVFEFDPATDAPWTKTGLETALLHIEKTV